MNKLYDKIYEAVEAGIQKALIIDPKQDISIEWKEKEIAGNASQTILNHYFNEMMNCPVSEMYEKFQEFERYSLENGIKYKVQNIDELNNIIINLHNSLFQNHIIMFALSGRLIKSIDFSQAVTFILLDGAEVNIPQDTTEIEFLKIKYNGLDFILHKDLKYYRQGYKIKEVNKYQYDSTIYANTIEEAKKDFDGWNNTYNNVNQNRYIAYTAYDYCCNKLNDISGYRGYIPGFGELYTICEYRRTINDLLEFIGLGDITNCNTNGIQAKYNSITKLPMSDWLMSSTEAGPENTWAYDFDDNAHVALHNINTGLKYLPFFKKI